MMSKIAFVLGGGGARGALQVGAIRALIEAGVVPNLLVGSSVGAVNAAYLAIKGIKPESVQSLTQTWCESARQDLLPTNPVRLAFSVLLRHKNTLCYQKLKELFIANGLDPALHFEEIRGTELVLVATDLLTGKPTWFGNVIGTCTDEPVLDAVLASACLPPWMRPVESHGKLLIDGAIVSLLPIEPAVAFGATEIYALDLGEWIEDPGRREGWISLLNRIVFSTMIREKMLELSLASLHGVQVRMISLSANGSIPISNFQHTRRLIEEGCEITRREIMKWKVNSNNPPGLPIELHSQTYPGSYTH